MMKDDANYDTPHEDEEPPPPDLNHRQRSTETCRHGTCESATIHRASSPHRHHELATHDGTEIHRNDFMVCERNAPAPYSNDRPPIETSMPLPMLSDNQEQPATEHNNAFEMGPTSIKSSHSGIPNGADFEHNYSQIGVNSNEDHTKDTNEHTNGTRAFGTSSTPRRLESSRPTRPTDTGNELIPPSQPPPEIQGIPPLLDAYTMAFTDTSGATRINIIVNSTDRNRSGPYDAGLFNYRIGPDGHFHIEPSPYANWLGLTGCRVISKDENNPDMGKELNQTPTDQKFSGNTYKDEELASGTNLTMTEEEIYEYNKWQQMKTDEEMIEFYKWREMNTEQEIYEYNKWQENKDKSNDEYFARDKQNISREISEHEETYVYDERLKDLVPRRLQRVRSPTWSDGIRAEDVSKTSSPYIKSSMRDKPANLPPPPLTMVPREITCQRPADINFGWNGLNDDPLDLFNFDTAELTTGGPLGKRKRGEEDDESSSEPSAKRHELDRDGSTASYAYSPMSYDPEIPQSVYDAMNRSPSYDPCSPIIFTAIAASADVEIDEENGENDESGGNGDGDDATGEVGNGGELTPSESAQRRDGGTPTTRTWEGRLRSSAASGIAARQQSSPSPPTAAEIMQRNKENEDPDLDHLFLPEVRNPTATTNTQDESDNPTPPSDEREADPDPLTQPTSNANANGPAEDPDGRRRPNRTNGQATTQDNEPRVLTASEIRA